MNRFASLCACLLLIISVSCDSLPIDPYKTFNVTHDLHFSIPANGVLLQDTANVIATGIDLDSDYAANKSSAALLKTSVVDRVVLQSGDASFNLENFATVQLLVGADTVASDSIPLFTGPTFSMTVTHKDIADQLKNKTFNATLHYSLRVAPVRPVSVTATITIIHTAEPL